MKVRVDRDDVAMGDSADHRRELEVPRRRRLRRLLAGLRPEVSVSGGSTWLVCVSPDDARVADPATSWVGGYADGVGLRVLRHGDRRLAELAGADGSLSVHFHYYAMAPAPEFFAALERGELPDRDALAALGRRRAAEAEEQAARERERTSSARLLSAEAVAALTRFGAAVAVHADDYARIEVGEETWVLRRDRFWVHVGIEGPRPAYPMFRPPDAAAEPVLVARAGTLWRAAAGLDPAPAPTGQDVPEVRHQAGLWLWTWSRWGREHEARWWPDGEEARAWAPYARLTIAEVVEHLGGGLSAGSGSGATD